MDYSLHSIHSITQCPGCIEVGCDAKPHRAGPSPSRSSQVIRDSEARHLTEDANSHIKIIQDHTFWAGLKQVIGDIEPICYATNLSYITQVMGTTKFVVVGTFSAMELASLGSDHWMLFIHHKLVSPQFWMI